MNENQDALVHALQFSGEEQQQFSVKLWELLKWQAEKYNGIDSTSMPAERAQELLASIVYTLTLTAREDGISPERMLQTDFRELLQRGQEILEEKKKKVYADWSGLCLQAPAIPNVYYVDTVKNLGVFFQRYDIYYEAHQIPCSIDYPLLKPVPEALRGISYLETYIRHLRLENRFVNYFSPEAVKNRLRNALADVREDYANLCEPVLTAAIGRTLLGYDPCPLVITEQDVSSLYGCFENQSGDAIYDSLREAVSILCSRIGSEETMTAYFEEELTSLSLRIETAVATGCLANVLIV